MKTNWSNTILILVGSLLPLGAAEYLVTTEAEWGALPTLGAGDEVVVQDGTYDAVQVAVTFAGSASEPVTLRAQTPGGVKFTGATQLILEGQHGIVTGLSFDNGGGPAQKEGLVKFEQDSSSITLRNCLMRNFNSGVSDTNWIFIEGYNHTVEYCTLEGKNSLNSTIFIKPTEGDATMTTPRNHKIRRNYFGTRTNIGSNGYETIRIADSSRQSYEMNCVIEENYFYQAISTSSSAEPEVISNKSRGNVYRRNVFDDCDGQLTLRHGRNCVVEENWFKGTGAAYESGVRIIGTGHIVRNNLIQNVNGTRYHAAIAIMDGAYGDTSNQYEGVENTIIEGNVVIDCAAPLHIGIDSGREGYDQPPINTTLTNNRFYHSATDDPLYIIEADATFSSVSGNLAYSAGGEYGDLSRLGNGYSISNNMNLTPPFSDWVTPDQVGHDFSLPHNRPRLRCTQLDATSGEAELSFPALTGEVYTVYVSSDLESWTEVDSNLSVLSDGELSYTLDLATLRTAGTLTQARTNFVRVARMAEASNPPSGSTGGLYLESNGTVVIEAEGFSAQAARSDASAWITSTTLAGASGSYIESPELGANTATWTTGASVSYDISFSTPGTYYLHARFQAATTSGDSFFFGTNGTEIGVDNTGVSTAWVWDNDESEPIVITAPGTYTLTLARREDGIKIDRFLLTTDANASFSGVGPASSPIQE